MTTQGHPFRAAAEEASLLDRPLRPNAAWFRRERRTAWLIAVALGLAVALGAVWTASVVVDLVRVHRIWAHGVDAEAVTLRGEERARWFVFRRAKFDVEYTDLAGGRHRGKTSLIAIGIGGDAGSGLRYDPEHPDDFATSYEYDRTPGRVLFTVLVIVMLVGSGAAGSKSARSKLRELADARATILAGGIGIPLRIVMQNSELHDGRVIAISYTLELPEGMRIERRCVVARPPFLLHVATNHVLGLRHPQRPELVVLLDADLNPLEADAGEAERVRKRYQDQRDATPRA